MTFWLLVRTDLHTSISLFRHEGVFAQHVGNTRLAPILETKKTHIADLKAIYFLRTSRNNMYRNIYRVVDKQWDDLSPDN